MNGRTLGLTLTATVMAATAALAVGCQTYDFEPVNPLAISQDTERVEVGAVKFKANLMLLVDKSGSMNLPTNSTSTCTTPTGGACNCDATGGGICGTPGKSLCDPNQCPTRWSELQRAMSTFLSSAGDVARYSLAQYPTNSGCGLDTENPALGRTGYPTEDTQVALSAKATEIRTILNGVAMCPICSGANCADCTGGGTPTGKSIRQIGVQVPAATDDRDSYLLLLTDGLPNCNPNNPNDGTTGSSTENLCSPSNGTCTLASGCQPPNNRIGCLDDQATVAEIAALRTSKGVKTIVIGLGAETSGGPGPNVLTAMAQAGGFKDTYYQAANGTDLQAILEQIKVIVNADACKHPLTQPPVDLALVAVYVGPPEGPLTKQPNDQWQYNAAAGGPGGQIELLGDLCTRVSTSATPLTVEIRVLKPI